MRTGQRFDKTLFAAPAHYPPPRSSYPPAGTSWRLETMGAVVIALGFIVSIVSISKTNGEITSYIDVGALLAGVGAIGLSLGCLSRYRWVVPQHRRAKLGAAIAIMALGALHLARGLGAFA